MQLCCGMRKDISSAIHTHFSFFYFLFAFIYYGVIYLTPFPFCRGDSALPLRIGGPRLRPWPSRVVGPVRQLPTPTPRSPGSATNPTWLPSIV